MSHVAFFLHITAKALTKVDVAAEGGAVVAPGELYGEAGADHVRIAVVQPDDRIALVANRLGAV